MKAKLNAVSLTVENGVCLLSGVLTRQTVCHLSPQNIAKALQTANTVFDFKQIKQVDTAGLAWVCALLEQANAKNCQLSLVNLPEQLVKLATLSGVEGFLPIH